MYAVTCRPGYTTMAINNFVVIVEENEEKVVGMRKTRALSQSSTIKQPPVRAALCSLPLSFRSQCLLAGTDSRNVRLLYAPLCWSAGV